MKNCLLIAFHFPPYGGGSGVHRATKFFQYLPENGWSPYVLTATTVAYETVQKSGEGVQFDAPERRRIFRALALDAQRHLGIKGRYFGWTGIPDRWASWLLGAIPVGLFMVYRKRVDAIVVTFPIASAVLIGWILHRLTGKPLLVDFRDSMTEDHYPSDPSMRAIHQRIERKVIESGARFVFTAESARRMYLQRYPKLQADKCVVISNGYDEDDFTGIPWTAGQTPAEASPRQPLRLVHAGLVYPDERDPRPFFRALSRLKKNGSVNAERLRIELRAPGSEEYFAQLLKQCEIEDIVHLLPSLPHKRALKDIAAADALLVLQAANCNHQIPAKVYEYLRLGRPILALTPEEGDTAGVLRTSGGATRVDLADENAIFEVLPGFIASVGNGTHPLPEKATVQTYSRRSQAAALAECLNQVVPNLSQKEPLPVSWQSHKDRI